MARPIPPCSHPPRNGKNGDSVALTQLAGLVPAPEAEAPAAEALANWDDDPPEAGELARENARLRQELAEAERMVAALKQEAELALLEQQRQYEAMLEEKSELIRELHCKVQEAQDRPARGSAPREEELMALSEELERERRQLKEDEAALMEQMSQMEVQMSRERAELARQRSELQRLQNEIRHELELAARDATLRERLAPLQRRHQELTRRGGSPSAPTSAEENSLPAEEGRADSGFFRRLFG